MSGFVALHLHSEYSLLDGACRISDIPARVLECGHNAVALTDHGVLYGAVKFYKACRAAGVKPIIGCEVYVAARSRFDKEGRQDSSGYHLILLAKNEIGYRNLIRMVSLSFTEGFYSRPRIDLALLKEHAAGLVALSGCIAGQIPRAILSGDMAGAETLAIQMRDMFEPDSFYLEVQDHGLPEEKTVRDALKEISGRTGIPLVATNDTHYLRKRDAETQAALLCIQTGSVLSEGRPFGFENDEFYYKTTEEMEALFRDFPGAVENTEKIAAMCDFDFTFGHFELPVFPAGEEGAEALLRRLTEEGMRRAIAEGKLDLEEHTADEYREQMEYELSVIHKMGFDDYYLIVRDFIAFARNEGIPVGPGRGSGAGSIVAYFSGITDVDSLRYRLLFERFLNPERISMPDFDTDFCYNRRDEVFAYVRRKYGEDHVAQIVTFGTLAARAAVKDVGRVLGMAYRDVDEIAALIPRELGITLRAALEGKELREKYDTSPEVRRLLDIAMALEGMPRHTSTHAAGVVITERPVSDYVPLAVNGDVTVTQYDMDAVAELGLVKFDFLALRYLTILSDAEKEIQTTCPDFSLENIPMDDPAVYRMISDGDTAGVFQLESGGMRQMLGQLQPSSLEEITAAIALYRPGPMDAIPTFIARKSGKEKVTYDIPALADILDVTYGCIVYQEQVMQIFRTLAGYSFAKADLVRRAMAKKKAAVLEAERESFLAGCTSHGIDGKKAEKIFDDMASFASYAFNKSHATAYSVTTYRTAYLKKHYPAAYLCALLTSVLGSPPKIAEYISEAGKRGIRVLPPDINLSKMNFSVCGKDIRFGLLALKNVGVTFVGQLIDEREKNGAFTSFENFLSRLSDGDLNRRQVESLIKCGAFDSLGIFRSKLLATYELQIDAVIERKHGALPGQLDIFAQLDGTAGDVPYHYPDVPEFSARDLLLLEKESSGMYFSGHLLDGYREDIESGKCDEIADILAAFAEEDTEENTEKNTEKRYRDRTDVTVCGMVTAKTVKTTKAGARMAFLTLEDRRAEIEVIVFPKQFERYIDILTEDSALRVRGTVSDRDEDGVKILASMAEPLRTNEQMHDEPRAEAKTSSDGRRLFLRVPSLSAPVSREALGILKLAKGDTPVLFFDAATGKYVAPKDTSVTPSDKLLGALRALLGADNVIYK